MFQFVVSPVSFGQTTFVMARSQLQLIEESLSRPFKTKIFGGLIGSCYFFKNHYLNT